MSLRTKRQKKTGKIFLKGKTFLKLRLIPWIRTKSGCVWLASMAVSNSNRQVNDWLNRRGNQRVRRLDMSLTGKSGNLSQALAIRFLRECVEYIPVGDSIALRCESVVPDKQFRIWKRWFKNHEDPAWEISEEHKSFFLYKQSSVE